MSYKRHFTLIEVLAASGVLVLLVALMMQLFSTSQRLWITSERSGSINADAGAAMELMCGLINSVQFSYDSDENKNTVFSLKNDVPGKSVLIFVAKVERSFPHKINRNCFVSFQRGSGDDSGNKSDESKLYMTMISDSGPDSEDTFYSLFPPYWIGIGGADPEINTRDEARNALKKISDKLLKEGEESDYCQIIAENVLAFDIRAYQINADGEVVEAARVQDINEPPRLLELRLTTMEKENYEKYRAMSDGKAKDNFRDQNQRTFSRSIFIGDRWALEKPTAGGGSGN